MELLPKEIAKDFKSKRQILFIQEYVKDRNGTQAAIRAGYTKKNAKVSASQLLTKPNIQKGINYLYEQIRIRNEVGIDEVIAVLASQLRFDIAELFDENDNLKSVHDIPLHMRNSIEEITVNEIWEHDRDGNRIQTGVTKKIKTASRQGAAKMLLQHLGAFAKHNKQKRTQVAVFNMPDNNRVINVKENEEN